MARPKKRKVSKAEQKSARRVDAARALLGDVPEPLVVAAPVKDKVPVELPDSVVIRDLAARLNLPVGKIMGELVKNGILATLNDSVDFETAAIVVDELGFEARHEQEELEAVQHIEATAEGVDTIVRPPVVTIMGHVDHGKTSLLDAIRRTNIVAEESGGITQHIGAYQVEINTRVITFLDTPGHEAFAALRAHGANITDIVILVVAATEGVRPQTIEALSHARAANVPIIVALTKIDLPDANLDRVKRELADHNLIPEEWGGKTLMVPVSAKKGENIDQLLEMVLLLADLEDLKVRVSGPAVGVVIESHLQAGLGPLATVLLQEGTCKLGDALVAGSAFGKIRVMDDWRGKKLRLATPGMPVQIAGLSTPPLFGEKVRVVSDERTARQMVQTKTAARRTISLGRASNAIKEGSRELPVVLKADVQGSLEAIKTALENLSTKEVSVRLIQTGIGPVSDSDIHLAETANALVLGFRVPTLPTAKRLAEQVHVEVSSFAIIYQLIDEITAALSQLLAPEIVEVELGKLSVLKVFTSRGSEVILGGRVTDGTLERQGFVKIMRAGQKIGDGKMSSLQREKESVPTVAKGFECGLGIETKVAIAPGDEIIEFRTEERSRKLEKEKSLT